MFEHLSNCHGEITALLSGGGALAACIAWLRAKWHHNKMHKSCSPPENKENTNTNWRRNWR